MTPEQEVIIAAVLALARTIPATEGQLAYLDRYLRCVCDTDDDDD